MNLRRRLERLERLFRQRPRYACAVEEMSDAELYMVLARGTARTAEQWAALPDEGLAALLGAEPAS